VDVIIPTRFSSSQKIPMYYIRYSGPNLNSYPFYNIWPSIYCVEYFDILCTYCIAENFLRGPIFAVFTDKLVYYP
jgi:hypothetical protein